jgi:hypothetical protein
LYKRDEKQFCCYLNPGPNVLRVCLLFSLVEGFSVMNTLAIGHAEIYIYPENAVLPDHTIAPRRIDVSNMQELAEVLSVIPNETSFSLLLVMNECVVGNGNYFMNNDNAVILREYGACVGFLIKPLALLRESRQHVTEVL